MPAGLDRLEDARAVVLLLFKGDREDDVWLSAPWGYPHCWKAGAALAVLHCGLTLEPAVSIPS